MLTLPWPDVIAENTATADHLYDILDDSEDVTIKKNGETAIEDAAYEEAVGAFADIDTDDIAGFDIAYRRGTVSQRISFQLPYEAESTGDTNIVITGTYDATAAD